MPNFIKRQMSHWNGNIGLNTDSAPHTQVLLALPILFPSKTFSQNPHQCSAHLLASHRCHWIGSWATTQPKMSMPSSSVIHRAATRHGTLRIQSIGAFPHGSQNGLSLGRSITARASSRGFVGIAFRDTSSSISSIDERARVLVGLFLDQGGNHGIDGKSSACSLNDRGRGSQNLCASNLDRDANTLFQAILIQVSIFGR